MKYINQIINFIHVMLLLTTCALSAQAQASHVFVSATDGADGGNCSIATPCREVNYALTQVSAGGSINIISAGIYAPMLIEKSVTIQTAPGIVATIASTFPFTNPDTNVTTQTSVAVSGATNSLTAVTLRGLTLNGTGATGSVGILARGLTFVQIGNTRVQQYGGAGILVIKSNNLFVTDSTVTNCNGGVSIVDNSAVNSSVVIERSQFNYNSVNGLNVNLSNAASQFRLVLNRITANINGTGVRLSNGNTGAQIETTIENSRISSNSITGLSTLGAQAKTRVANSIIVNNATGMTAQLSGAILTRTNNTIEGNTTDGTFTGTFTAQ